MRGFPSSVSPHFIIFMRKRVVVIATGTFARRAMRRAMSSTSIATTAVASAAIAAPSPPQKKAGYKAFGSFHTASPEALFAGEAATVKPPPDVLFPVLLPNDKLVTTTAVAAPQSNRSQFTIDFGSWTYLNHGAFGGSTMFAAQVANAWRQVADRQPLLFNDRLLFPYVVQSIMALAEFVNVRDPQELVLLTNATSGLHAVLQSVLADKSSRTPAEDRRDQVVFCFSTRYGAVRKMLQAIENEGGESRLRVHEEPLSLEESYDDDTVLQILTGVLKKLHNEENNTRCALVIVDHITSNTGVKLPVKEIVRICHEQNVPVLVDGAHGLLNLPLDLNTINADYYVGNCHKWFCSPKGAAFLHVNKRNGLESTRCIAISPRVISHGFFDGFQSAFMWIGFQDYSPWLAIPKCIEYWRHHGVEECRTYMHTLAQEATELLYRKWNMPEELQRAEQFPKHKRHAMRLVRLPPGPVFGVDTSCDAKATSADAKFVQDTLHHTYGIEVPIKCVDDKLYVRISAHMYNSLADYERLAQVLLTEQE